jgi:putative sterol carrier protein
MVPAARRGRPALNPTKEHRMPSYPFLSDEWLDEARKIRAEYAGKTPPVAHIVRMNLNVTAVPFSDEDIKAHMDTSNGELELDTGHLESHDLLVTVDYDTAKAILVEGNPQAGMQAFMAGKVRVEGDMAKLMALQAQPAASDPNAAEMATKLREITE